ncbi:hypothetical protein NVIE_018100 [Nitrososphaera viennensis EN76]|uniref:Uncharacterized protein n=1 Tax=Nitrososphaera viennensis EN76 TaxID=926571 RepID=A0A060HHI6_9ARCH|nr:hypothetical protein NVIE_018100 [Nitrososphaera viennensis EN76]
MSEARDVMNAYSGGPTVTTQVIRGAVSVDLEGTSLAQMTLLLSLTPLLLITGAAYYISK